jgi:hypothetical protein
MARGSRKFNLPFAAGDHFLRTQPLHHPVEVGKAHAQHVSHHLLRKRQFETGLSCASNSVEARVQLEKKMRQPLNGRATADVDDVFGVSRRFLNGDPAQSQTELRPPVTKCHIGTRSP